MKNFSEVMVTKKTLQLEIKVRLAPVDKCYCTVTLNGQMHLSGVISKPVEIVQYIPLNDPVDLFVSVKRFHPNALVVEAIIDGNELLPLYETYANPATNYLDFNGDWKLKIHNFYQWFHKVSGKGWIA